MRSKISLSLIGVVAVILVLAVGALSKAQEGDQCDMKTTRKGRACEICGPLAASDVVSESTYWECDGCGFVSAEAGSCSDCDESPELTKKKSGKDACGSCFGGTHAAELCVKTDFHCATCLTRSAKAGECECGESFEKQESIGEIAFECDGCGASAPAAGNCDDDECDSTGKALVRRCSRSGRPPHGS